MAQTPTKAISLNDRQVPSVPPPIATKLESSKLWVNDKPDVDVLKEHLRKEGRLHEDDLVKILNMATAIFKEEPTLLRVGAPITICGDIHGQFYDLLRLLEAPKVGGTPGETNYLFLGDYVDRGNFSIECVILLWSYKILFPSKFFLIRGNHECRHLTDYFTFKEECVKKYNEDVYNDIMLSFDSLPLAAVMNDQFLCVHGGISPTIKTLQDIEEIDRFQETPQAGPMCDLLWADPIEGYEEDEDTLFTFNEARGCSFGYGFTAVCEFLDNNKLLSLIRAHEAQDLGFRMHKRNAATGFPSVITLFSAPNYLDAYGNKAAVMVYEDNVMNIRQFNNAEHPYWLPNFMDVFTWSMPFVAEKVAEILLSILKLCDDDKEEEENAAEEIPAERKAALQAKLRSVSKLMKMYNTLRKEREAVMQLKGLSGTGHLPPGLLTDASAGDSAAIRNYIGNFNQAKKADKINEKRPPSKDEIKRKPKSSATDLLKK